MSIDPNQLRAQRSAAARDVLACGVLLHELLSGQPVLDQPDIAAVIARMTPLGREPRAPAVERADADPRGAEGDREPLHCEPGAAALSERTHPARRAERLARIGRR